MLAIIFILIFVLFFIYELSCIHVPKNFEAPFSYRINTVLIKLVTITVRFCVIYSSLKIISFH